MKKAWWAVVALMSVGLLSLVGVWLTGETVAARVLESELSQALGRRASVEKVSIGLWDGRLTLKQIEIADTEGELLLLQGVQVRWSNRNLMRGRWRIDELRVSQLRVVGDYADGGLNFRRLLSGIPAGQGGDEAQDSPKIDLEVGHITLAEIGVFLGNIGDDQSRVLAINHAEISGFQLQRQQMGLKVDLMVLGQPLQLVGEVDLAGQTFSSRVQVGPLDLADLAERSRFTGYKIPTTSGLVSGQMQVIADLKEQNFRITLEDLRGQSLVYDGFHLGQLSLQGPLISYGRSAGLRVDGIKVVAADFAMKNAHRFRELQLEAGITASEGLKDWQIEINRAQLSQLDFLATPEAKPIKLAKMELSHQHTNLTLGDPIRAVSKTKSLNLRSLDIHMDPKGRWQPEDRQMDFNLSQVDVDFQSRTVAGEARIQDHGRLVFMRDESRMKLDLEALDLRSVSPVLLQGIGHEVDSGVMGVSFQVGQGDQQSGELVVELRKLELAAKGPEDLESSKVLGMPLGTAINLLSDDEGLTKLEFDVSGGDAGMDIHWQQWLGEEFAVALSRYLGEEIGQQLVVQMLPVLSSSLPANPLLAYKALKKGLRLAENLSLEPVRFIGEPQQLAEASRQQIISVSNRLKKAKGLTISICSEAAAAQQGEIQEKAIKAAEHRMAVVQLVMVEELQVSPEQVVRCQPKVNQELALAGPHSVEMAF